MELTNSIRKAQTENETFKQKLLRKLYPVIRNMGKKGKNGTILINNQNIAPLTPFYDLAVTLNNGEMIRFSEFRGKKVLLVNTASGCGYTGQYAELQSLHEQMGDKLVIIAFPANDFAGQEKSNDQEIAQFCQVNYGVTFSVAKKGVVIKIPEQQPVYNWLTDKNSNGWNDHEPDWNFGKYLISGEGMLTHYFGPSVSPMEAGFLLALK